MVSVRVFVTAGPPVGVKVVVSVSLSDLLRRLLRALLPSRQRRVLVVAAPTALLARHLTLDFPEPPAPL